MNQSFIKNKNNTGYILKGITILLIILSVVGYAIDVDYYLMRPGTAEHLRPLIQVEGNTTEESGRLMLTTVSSIPGNLLFYILAQLDKNTELVAREEVLGSYDMDDELYREVMLLYMEQSQHDAIYNAFKLAGKDVELVEKAVLVRDVAPESKATNILKPGDIIYKVDGIEMKNSEQIIDYIKTKPIGSIVKVGYEREDEQMEADIELISHPEIEEARIGITIMTDRELIADRNVNIDTGLIGGSSAGLMFTLEIYNQLTESDITKGYYIAGTGTINSKGDVGQIGGIIHKVKAAQNAKAEIFFVPKDINEYDSNEKDAIARNEELGNPLKIVPVKHVSEVIEYLQALSPKK